MSSDVPGVQALARRIASGELQGPAAFDAVVALLLAHEAGPRLSQQEVARLRDEVALAVRQDRELCALLFEERGARGEAAGQQPAVEPMRHTAPERAAADAGRRERPRRPRREPADDDLDDDFRGAQRRSRLLGAAAVLAVLGGGTAFWWFTRSGPCDQLVSDICFDPSTKVCEAATFRSALEDGGVEDAQCSEVRASIATALEGVGNARRSKVFTRTLVEGLGFDPRGDAAPPVPKQAEDEPEDEVPVPVVENQPGITTLFVDRSHLYWTRPNPAGVYRASNIGGTVETIGSVPDPIDVTVTRDYVYWVSRAGPQTQAWVDHKRGVHDPAPLPTAGFLPTRAAFLGAEFVFADATTGDVFVASVSGGAPRKLTGDETKASDAKPGEAKAPPPSPGTGAAATAPKLFAGDAKTAYWATPAPVATLTAAALDGSTPPRVLARDVTDPRALLVDGSGVYWIEGASGSVLRIAAGATRVETLAAKQAGPSDLALDEQKVYWTNAEGGTVMALPKAGGEAVALATGQSAPTHLVVDGAAVYWATGGSVLRMPK